MKLIKKIAHSTYAVLFYLILLSSVSCSIFDNESFSKNDLIGTWNMYLNDQFEGTLTLDKKPSGQIYNTATGQESPIKIGSDGKMSWSVTNYYSTQTSLVSFSGEMQSNKKKASGKYKTVITYIIGGLTEENGKWKMIKQ